VREKLSQLSIARRLGIPRLLALILLATISWGANAEVTHHHGFSKRTSERRLQGSLQCAALYSSEASRKRSSTRDECLICQLHQNLSAGALVQLPHQTPVIRQLPRPTAAVIAQRIQFITSERGRAPPVNL
jgi:hypothetical protein